jgi:hypothetical protein
LIADKNDLSSIAAILWNIMSLSSTVVILKNIYYKDTKFPEKMSKYNPMCRKPQFFANGPAIWGGCVTRRKHRAESRYPAPAGPQSCHGARRVWRTFCRPGTKFCGHYACRGTNLLSGR